MQGTSGIIIIISLRLNIHWHFELIALHFAYSIWIHAWISNFLQMHSKHNKSTNHLLVRWYITVSLCFFASSNKELPEFWPVQCGCCWQTPSANEVFEKHIYMSIQIALNFVPFNPNLHQLVLVRIMTCGPASSSEINDDLDLRHHVAAMNNDIKLANPGLGNRSHLLSNLKTK